MDRVAWVLKEEMPKWCFGLAGRSTSFGEVYGDMFDHHTVVYEYASGTRVYALCQTRRRHATATPPTSSWAPRAPATWAPAASTGENKWQFPRNRHNNPYDAEQKALIDSVRSGKPINSGYHMANSTMSCVHGPDRLLHGQAR